MMLVTNLANGIVAGITGETNLVGLLGWPVGHSLSPLIHNTAFRELGLDWAYVPLPVAPDKLPAAVAGLEAMGFRGVNVTVPHKTAILPLLDELDDSARLVGAVNTVIFQDGRATGYNTDMTGFVRSLQAAAVEPVHKRATVLGVGGAARAVAHGLLAAGAARVELVGRESAKAAALAGEFGRGAPVAGHGWDELSTGRLLADSDILVNCTPMGMTPWADQQPVFDWKKLNRAAVVYDLVYRPVDTLFLRKAQECGHKTVSGLGMLVEQAALAFYLWTGQEPSRAGMRQAIAEALGRE